MRKSKSARPSGRGLEGCANALSIVRVHQGDELARVGVELLSGVTGDALIGWADVQHLGRLDVGQPEHLAHVLRHLQEPSLVLSGGLLSPLAGGDVEHAGQQVLGAVELEDLAG